MIEKLKQKIAAASKSMTVACLGFGLFLTEFHAELTAALPELQAAFDEDTYRLIVRVTLISGILLRVRKT